jgi:hypothetical protein
VPPFYRQGNNSWEKCLGTKKTKGKSTGTAKKSAKRQTTAKAKKPGNMAEVRENINHLVEDWAEDIATKVIEVAKTGQLAPAKYLFEAVGCIRQRTQQRPNRNKIPWRAR